MPIVDRSKFFTYKEAKVFVQKLDIKTYKEWLFFIANERKVIPHGLRVPTNPRTFYGDDVFESWGTFFGTENISNKDKAGEFLSYEDATKVVHALEITSIEDYKQFVKKTRTSELPAAPEKYYRKNGGSFSWKDFLKPRILSYDEAVKALKPYGLKRYSDFLELRKAGKCPKGVPSNPNTHYKSEWKGWDHFLEKEKKSSLLSLIK